MHPSSHNHQASTPHPVAGLDVDELELRVHAPPIAPSPERGANSTDLGQLNDPCTSAELAAVLGKSPKTIVDWCQERAYTLIPCFRLGNRWYHRVPDLVRWLNGIKSGRIEFRRKPRISQKRR